MKVEVQGQDNVALAYGVAGDRTYRYTLPVADTHVRVTNHDPVQGVMYSTTTSPAFPANWNMLDPGVQVIIPKGTSTYLYLRKKWYRRYVSEVEKITPPDGDVTATVEVETINWGTT